MRWMVDTRNKIEKQGDLEAHSFVKADIVASYYDDGPSVNVPAKLFDSIETLFERVPTDAAFRHFIQHGTLRVRRRWVENSLPDYELLEALSIAFGRIAELVFDAHKQMRLPVSHFLDLGQHQIFDRVSMGWRMPCMIGHEDNRTLLLSLADGTQLGFTHKKCEIDAKDKPQVRERYGDIHRVAFGRNLRPTNNLLLHISTWFNVFSRLMVIITR